MIVGQLTSLLLGDMKSSQQDQFQKMTNNISQLIILPNSGNVFFLSSRCLIADCVAVGSALVSHFSYYWQSQILNRSDVLDRYRAVVIDQIDDNLIMYDY